MMSFECLPHIVPRSKDGPQRIDYSKNILRVHIFDAKSNPYTEEAFLLKALSDADLAINIKSNGGVSEMGSSVKPSGSKRNGVIEHCVTKNMLLKLTETEEFETYVANASSQKIKDLIKTTVPSLTFGTAFSAINSLSMNSSTQGSVNNVLLLESIKDLGAKDPTKGEGETSQVEDITVIPASVSMSVLGCPLFEYGQHFFLDMGTGTTADNMYYITGIEHTLSPGQFETSLDLTFSGNGTVKNLRSILKAALPEAKSISETET